VRPESSDFVGLYQGALDAALCDELVRRFAADPRVQRGQIGHGVDLAKKDSHDLTISHHRDWDDLSRRVAQATLPCLVDYARTYPSLLVGALATAVADPATGQARTLQVEDFTTYGAEIADQLLERLYRLGDLTLQRYARGVGGYHHWHSEVYPRDRGCEELHRVLWLLWYLDDVADGGETELLHQRRRIQPRRGTLVVAPAGFTHTHKGHVPRSGDKHVLASWLLFQRAEALFPDA
jgi:hypothetical protein